jgi:hypothetical protein
MGLAGKKQDLLGETVLAVGTFDLLFLPAQIGLNKNKTISHDMEHWLRVLFIFFTGLKDKINKM